MTDRPATPRAREFELLCEKDEGYFNGYDEDPLWYNPGDLVICSECGGRGGFLECPNAENHKDEHPIMPEDDPSNLAEKTGVGQSEIQAHG